MPGSECNLNFVDEVDGAFFVALYIHGPMTENLFPGEPNRTEKLLWRVRVEFC